MGSFTNTARSRPFNDPYAGTGEGQGTQGSGINDFGTIVGAYIDGSGNYHGFMDRGGFFSTLDGPCPIRPWSFNYANFINDLGTVTGVYSDANYVAWLPLPRRHVHDRRLPPGGHGSCLKAQCSRY